MASLAADVERYADPAAFAREVNLPLLGTASLRPVTPGAALSQLLAASTQGDVESIVDGLAQTRQSLTLRSLLLAGFPNDPECFALGLALGRAWSRRGIKVAVVDLDGWNPTVLRPLGEPGEGFVDVLEYGCSFQRVAWEIVAGSLWLVGPGCHPSEEARLSDHPDWDRASRVFGARVDVTLYVAPFLHRPGLTGRLSKRMDAAVLTASVDRIARAELRDAFLELWGSDAPIIGCVGLDPNPAPAEGGVPTWPDAASEPGSVPNASPREDRAPGPPAAIHDPFRPIELPGIAAAAASAAAAVPSESPPAPHPEPTPPEDRSLLAALEEEVRTGAVARRSRRPRSRIGLLLGVAAVAAVVVVAAAWYAVVGPFRGARPVAETLPTGEERVLPPPVEPADGGERLAAPAAGEAPAVPPPANAPLTAGLAPGGGAADPTPLTVGPPAAGKNFRVHVASFRSESKVEPIVRDLRLKGADAWFEKAPDGSGWYRVFVGRFATEDEAEAYASWLLQNKWVDRAHAYPSTSR